MRKSFAIIFFSLIMLSCSKERRSDIAAGKMQDFVMDISKYAKGFNPDFIIIPQNGIELAFNNLNPEEGLNASYLSAIDGIGVEELYYNGGYVPDRERISMLRLLKPTKKVMVSEYVTGDADISDAYSGNYNEGFIAFVRTQDNYHYRHIPDTVPDENGNDITRLEQARNYLYLINNEEFASKEEMIEAISATNFDLVLTDLFFNDEEFTSSEVNRLKVKANGGKRLVISYINIGSAESFRYYWKKNWGLHHPLWIKQKYEGYDDEFWVKFWKKDWQEIIYGNDNSYMKKIIGAGFDGAYLDNVEAYYFLYYAD